MKFEYPELIYIIYSTAAKKNFTIPDLVLKDLENLFMNKYKKLQFLKQIKIKPIFNICNYLINQKGLKDLEAQKEALLSFKKEKLWE